MAVKPLDTVRESLVPYADRGIFQGFSEGPGGRFRFTWLLGREMELNIDTTKHMLRFRGILPGIPARSPLYADLKRFIEQRHDKSVPEHRRIDRRKAEASCLNRLGSVSISMQVSKNQYAYGTNRLINLVHELFVHLREAYPDYLMENFDVPEE